MVSGLVVKGVVSETRGPRFECSLKFSLTAWKDEVAKNGPIFEDFIKRFTVNFLITFQKFMF